MMFPEAVVMGNPYFTYRANVDEVIDGDTVDMNIDLGFRMTHSARVRILGVDTHEIYGVEHSSEEYNRGRQEAAFVKDWFRMVEEEYEGSDQWPLLVSTLKDRTGKYGRYLANIHRRDTGESLTDAILSEYPEVAD